VVRLGIPILIFIDPRNPFNRTDVDRRWHASYDCFLRLRPSACGKDQVKGLKRFQILNVENARVTEAGVSQLQKLRPMLKISF
jgi:hypothetical protein